MKGDDDDIKNENGVDGTRSIAAAAARSMRVARCINGCSRVLSGLDGGRSTSFLC